MARAHSAVALACLTLGMADVVYLNVAIAPSVLGGGGPVLVVENDQPATVPVSTAMAGARARAGGLAGSRQAGLWDARRGPRDPELAAGTGAEPGPEANPERGAGSEGGGRPGAGSDTLEPEAVYVHFARDRARLTAQARLLLEELAGRMLDEPSLRAFIDGHADYRGESHHNDVLSRRRAERVADYFETRGIPRARMTVRAFGERRPLARGPLKSANRQNRRVEIRVSPSPTQPPAGAP